MKRFRKRPLARGEPQPYVEANAAPVPRSVLDAANRIYEEGELIQTILIFCADGILPVRLQAVLVQQK